MRTPTLTALALALSLGADPATAAASPAVSAEAENRDFTRVLAQDLTSTHRTAKGAHAEAVKMGRLGPKVLRPYMQVGPLRAGSFTVRVAADHGCVTYTAGTGSYRPGPCVDADRKALRDPVTYAAGFMGRLVQYELRTQGFWTASGLYRLNDLRDLAGMAAPPGAQADGLADRNSDGIDDDARFAYRLGDRVACLQMPARPGQRWQVVHRPCAELPQRDLTAVPQAVDQRVLLHLGRRAANALRAESLDAGATPSQIADETLAALQRDLPEHYRLERVAPQVFIVRKGYWAASITFRSDAVGAPTTVRLGEI